MNIEETTETYIHPIYAPESGFDMTDWDTLVAAYYFASHWHGGQWSQEYSLLCAIDYHPGMLMTFDREDENVRMLYGAMVREYAPSSAWGVGRRIAERCR
jgi:hypothetical protein